MMYSIYLTEREYRELSQLAAHKHDCNLFNALERVGSTIWGEDLYEVESHIAWAVKTASEHPETGFVIRWQSPLGLKIHGFLSSIKARKTA